MKKILRILGLAGVVVGVGVFGYFCWGAFDEGIQTGFHLPALAGLPAGASDISFYRDHNITHRFACEFQISRADFQALALTRGWALRLPDAGVGFARYTSFLPEGNPERRPPLYVIAKARGLYFEDVRIGTYRLHVLWDEDSSRAYLYESNF
jgi:hypothetical protein